MLHGQLAERAFDYLGNFGQPPGRERRLDQLREDIRATIHVPNQRTAITERRRLNGEHPRPREERLQITLQLIYVVSQLLAPCEHLARILPACAAALVDERRHGTPDGGHLRLPLRRGPRLALHDS